MAAMLTETGQTALAQSVPHQASVEVQLGHSLPVQALLFDPQLQQLVSGSDDGSVRHWNAQSGRELRVTAPTGAVHALALAASGQTLVVAADDLEFWDAAGKVKRAASPSVNGGYSAVVTARSGPTVYAVAKQLPAKRTDEQVVNTGTTQLQAWDATTGTQIRQFAVPDNIHALALSPDGKTLAIGGDAAVHLMNLNSATIVRTLPASDGGVSALAFSPDGATLASGSIRSNQVSLWDLATGAKLRTAVACDGGVVALAWSPDGQTLAAGGFDQDTWREARELFTTDQALQAARAYEDTLRLLSPTTGQTMQALRGGAGGVWSLAWSTDGATLFSGSNDGSILSWSLGSDVARRLPLGSPRKLSGIATTQDGHTLIVADLQQSIHVWNLGNGHQVGSLEATANDEISAIAISPDGSTVAAGTRPRRRNVDHDSPRIRLWDLARQTPLSLGQIDGPTGDNDVHALAFSPNGRALAIGMGKGLRLWLRTTQKEVENALIDSYSITRNTRALAYSPDGRTVAAGRPLTLWDAVSGQALRPLGNPTSQPQALAYSPDGRMIAAGGERLELIDVGSGQVIRTLAGAKADIHAIAFSADGQTLVTGGPTLQTWDIRTGQALRTFGGHLDQITGVAFDKHGERIISSSYDGTTRLWQVDRGAELLRFVSFRDGQWIAITPEGYFAASAHGQDYLNLRDGDEVYGIDQFYDVFYRPDIVQARLDGEDISSLIALTVNDTLVDKPPKIAFTALPSRIATHNIHLCYRVTSAGGGIGDVRVFHNGKLVHSDAIASTPHSLRSEWSTSPLSQNNAAIRRDLRGLAQAARTAPPRATIAKPPELETCQDLQAVSGNNEISVTAFNASGTIQSPLYSRTVHASLEPEQSQLHILTIGIDRYRDSKATLNFAGKDAHDFASLLSREARSRFRPEDIHITALRDQDADKARITAVVQSLAQQMHPSDVFVLFVASHGLLMDSQFYMVTADYDGTDNRANFISSDEIVEISKRIPAFSQWLVFDSCHSGGIDGAFAGLYDARVSVLAKKLGLHLFASAQINQFASDNYEGNGLFTHVLLSNMRPHTPAAPTANTIVSIGQKTQRDTATLSNGAQVPNILNFGRDFSFFQAR